MHHHAIIGVMKPISGFPNYMISKSGHVQNIRTGHILTPVLKNGYYGIRLSLEGKSRFRSVHLLVFDTFIGQRTKGMHVDHIDGVRTNNDVSNLREVTPEENNKNRVHLTRGENVNTAKLTPEQVMDIRRRKSKGERTLDLANEYGIAVSSLRRIVNGQNWKHLPVLPVDNSFWGDPKKTGAISGKALREKYGEDYFSKIAAGKKIKRHCDTCTCNL